MMLSKRWSEYFSSIRFILFASYFIIILLSIAIIGVVSYIISKETIVDKIEAAGFQIVKQIEKNIDNDFHNKRNLLLAPYYYSDYIENINIYSSLNEQDQYLFKRQLGDLYLKTFHTTPTVDFVRFQIYYADGELMDSSDEKFISAPDEILKQAWFENTIDQNGKVHFSGPISHSPTDSALYALSIVIRDFVNESSFIVVKAEYDNELFEKMAQDEQISEHSQILIMNEWNEIVYNSKPQLTNVLSEQLFEQINIGSTSSWYGEEERNFFVYTKSEYSDWKTVIVMPESEIIGPLSNIKTMTMTVAIIAFLFTSLLSLLFGRRITRPILNLHKSVNRMKREDFSERVAVEHNDEIGRIAVNFNYMQEELQKLIESKYVNQIKLQQMELAMLYSQINPHFLYNTLDSIKAMSDYYGVSQIGDMSQALADMFRYNIKNHKEMVTVHDELEQIRAYIRIQALRFEERLHYIENVPEQVKALPILKMTLQPIVENSIFYAVESKRGQGKIQLTIQEQNGFIEILIEDNGIGIESANIALLMKHISTPVNQTQNDTNRVGLRNVYARHKIKWGDRFSLHIQSEVHTNTIIKLTYPIDQEM